jgi:hypothetical protein
MGNIALATPDRLSRAALTSGPSAPGSPVSNLVRREPSDALVLTDLSQAHVGIDFGEPYAPRLVAPLYAGTTQAATWRLRGAADAAALLAAPAYDSGPLPFGRGEAGLRHRRGLVHDWIWDPAMPACRHWRIDFADPANPGGRLVLGNLVMDRAWRPARNIAYGGSLGLVDPSRRPRSVEGRRDPLARRPYMGTEFGLDFGTEDEMYGAALDLDEAVGTTGAVLYLRDPEATAHRQKKALLGLFSELRPVVDAHFGLYSKRFQIEELIP